MLTIRQAQLDVFGRDSMQRFERELLSYLRRAWPRECALAGDDDQLLTAVRRIVQLAQTQGYATSRELTLHALIVFSLGIGFETDPQCSWAAASLRNVGIANATARIEALYDEMVEWLGEVGGRDSEKVVRALLRVRRHDFTSALSDDPDDRVDAICDLLECFWPEKFAFQEAGPTARLVREATAKAAAHGIAGSIGESVFATLGFFLGHDFEFDPMHPWAAQALALEPAGEPRARALMNAGLARLAASLTTQ